ncbi:TPA: hypothetical protein LWK33_002476, partial [Listeria innocua]|nr:hypothetical protein [Listeria innocua]
SINEKQKILHYYGIEKFNSEKDIEYFFRKIVYKKIKENEIDLIAGVS